jgi:hypothetical protein
VKREKFEAPGCYIERQWDRWNGAMFIAWKPHRSQLFTDRRSLLRFVSWPAKTPTGDRLRAWLDSFEQEAPAEAPVPTADASISPEVLATGFGPECHLDEGDPNFQTRTII